MDEFGDAAFGTLAILVWLLLAARTLQCFLSRLSCWRQLIVFDSWRPVGSATYLSLWHWTGHVCELRRFPADVSFCAAMGL